MKVILSENVPKLGHEWDLVTVKDGFARNYLLPQKKARLATPALIKQAEKRQEERLKKLEEVVEKAKEMAEKLKGAVLVFKKKARGEKLYGSINEKAIADDLAKEHKIEVSKDMITLKEPIKTLGDHKVKLHLAEGVDIQIIVKVEGEK